VTTTRTSSKSVITAPSFRATFTITQNWLIDPEIQTGPLPAARPACDFRALVISFHFNRSRRKRCPRATPQREPSKLWLSPPRQSCSLAPMRCHPDNDRGAMRASSWTQPWFGRSGFTGDIKRLI
jgi:hypothetical protein